MEGHYWLSRQYPASGRRGRAAPGHRLLPRNPGEARRTVALEGSLRPGQGPPGTGPHLLRGPRLAPVHGRPRRSWPTSEPRRALAPDNSGNHLYLAQTLMRLHHPERPSQELQRVTQIQPICHRAPGPGGGPQAARRLLARPQGSEVWCPSRVMPRDQVA